MPRSGLVLSLLLKLNLKTFITRNGPSKYTSPYSMFKLRLHIYTLQVYVASEEIGISLQNGIFMYLCSHDIFFIWWSWTVWNDCRWLGRSLEDMQNSKWFKSELKVLNWKYKLSWYDMFLFLSLGKGRYE